jgi:hypothetical protein
MKTIEFKYLNLIAKYMLHVLAKSQSIGLRMLSQEYQKHGKVSGGEYLVACQCTAAPHPSDYGLPYFALHQLRLLPCKRRYVEG